MEDLILKLRELYEKVLSNSPCDDVAQGELQGVISSIEIVEEILQVKIFPTEE